jgi:hypothetical protein
MKTSGHSWKSPELEKCELCGDKDWMADKYCAGNPNVAKDREKWLVEIRKQDHGKPMAGQAKD